MLNRLLAHVAKDGLVTKAPTFPWRREGLTGIVGSNGVYVCDIIKYGSYGHHYATVVELIVEAVNAAHAQQEDECLTTTINMATCLAEVEMPQTSKIVKKLAHSERGSGYNARAARYALTKK